MAAATALANLAMKPVPQQVKSVYRDRSFEFGRDYIIPTPFDPRLIFELPVAVAQAANKSGVSKAPISDFEAYKRDIAARMGIPVYEEPSFEIKPKL